MTGDGSAWKPGELVLLWASERDVIVLPLEPGPRSVGGRGVVDLTPLIGAEAGGAFEWAGRRYRALRPSLADLFAILDRRAQVVTQKDSARLLQLAGVGPGARVAEAGSGSGWLTVALAFAVGPTGAVYSFDRRPEFLDVARQNLRRVGLEARVTFEERDVAREGFAQSGLEAILLDLPEPWTLLDGASRALAPGGRLCAYLPTYNQLERTVRALRDARFAEVRAEELLLRPIEVGEGGTRPAFEMLGHTGFLVTSRWMGPPW
ncbi:MAG TPA: tRNA (adenine-N1)-methyltransferase [Thermoplasmata archaeon]|nr:tRNA (adenine-N1)-methyltransferase [Thermoplasmata archaeon]